MVRGVSGTMVGIRMELVVIWVLVVGSLVGVLLSNVPIIGNIAVFTPRNSSQDFIQSNIHLELRSFQHIFDYDFPDSWVWVRFQMFLVLHNACSSLV